MGSALTLMTISGHNKTMKKAKVSELKARLSSYLADVRRGDTLVVCDRSTPIARRVPMEEETVDPQLRFRGEINLSRWTGESAGKDLIINSCKHRNAAKRFALTPSRLYVG
jgi:antitoxin (DNA-binding transcriptional repressor) of toxin-antitoxin stability system